MLAISPSMRIFVCLQFIYFRKGIDRKFRGIFPQNHRKNLLISNILKNYQKSVSTKKI